MSSTPAAGQCLEVTIPAIVLRSGESIGILAGPEVPPSLVEDALVLWRRCPEHGVGFPALVSGRGRTRTVTVAYHVESDSTVCGQFLGSRIDLFAFARDALGKPHFCGSPELSLAHEIGHVLGLPHVQQEDSCRLHVMSTIEEFNLHRRWVHDEECLLASRLWLTTDEIWLASAHPPAVTPRPESERIGGARHLQEWTATALEPSRSERDAPAMPKDSG